MIRSGPALGAALEGAVVLGLLALAAGSLLSGYEAGADVDFALGRSLPSLAHPLGTDHAGRDLGARLVDGARRWWIPGAVAALSTLLFGVPLGALTGWPGRGWLGTVLREGVAAVVALPAALPSYVLLLLAGVSFGFDPVAIGVVTGAMGAAELAEALRGRIGREAGAEYVEAAGAEGLSGGRVLARHLLWLQGRGLSLRFALAAFPRVLLVEAALSCLPPGGFGVKEPLPSWGNMLVRPMQDLVLATPRGAAPALVWNALVPTAALVGTVAAFGWLSERWGARLEGRER